MIAILLITAVAFYVSIAAESNKPGNNTNIVEAIEVSLEEKLYGTTQGSNQYWYLYTADSDGEYTVSALDKNPEKSTLTSRIVFEVLDESGTSLTKQEVGCGSGRLSSAKVTLNEGDTIYIRLYSETIENNQTQDIDYLIIMDKVEDGILIDPLHTDISDSSDYLSGNPGTTMENALVIPSNEKVFGTLEGRSEWYAFETENTGDVDYTISAARTKIGNDNIEIIFCDSLGDKIEQKTLDNSGFFTNITQNIQPNSVYYIVIYSNEMGSNCEYFLTVKCDDQSGNSIVKRPTESDSISEETSTEDIFD